MFNYLNKIFSKKSAIFFAVFVFAFLFSFQTASARSYSYDLIDVKININQDSTFDVTEEQTFNYIGEYHDAWRSISLNKTDGISDVKVIDGETGLSMVYSAKRLDKVDPASWGKFTHYKENGAENIIWYYDLSDSPRFAGGEAGTTHKWIIKYKVHGGIGFFPNYDELYWNIFTDYEVPVKEATVTVMLPSKVNYTTVVLNAYRTDVYQQYFINKNPLSDKKSFLFSAKNFKAQEYFKIQISWPKGIVSQSAYWQDFFRIYLFYILAALITLVNFVFIVIHWYFREVRPVGRGTIIPQYTPPQNLRPAMAEVLLKEKVTDKGWSATVIDLAVRGYIKIKEDGADWTEIIGRSILVIILLGALFLIVFAVFDGFSGAGIIIGGIIIWIFLIRFSNKAKEFFSTIKDGKLKEIFAPKNYVLEKIDNSDESVLEDYERKFLETLFRYGNGKYFSTSVMKKASNARKRQFYEYMEKVKDGLYSETTIDTGAFETGVEKEKLGAGIFLSAIVIILFIFALLKPAINPEFIFIIVFIFNVLLLYVYLNYEAYLSKKGLILKEDWLGFKMYLETAERYRMQNLTPATFEKYLPYAIIFGIEEKWGKAFETFNIQNPSWYIGAYVGSGFHSGRLPAGRQGFSSGGGFSPAGFSASFSSSFSSAFSSAGGAGSAGGGGGGGAGGGGGGGGGGAS